MTTIGIVQIILYFLLLVGLGYPLGMFMARVYKRERTFLDPVSRSG